MKKGLIALFVCLVIVATVIIAASIFNTSFANATVDYFSFFAASFLIIDAAYKIIRKREAFFPNQLIRFIRLIIGGSVFTIHAMQFIWGF